MRMLPLLFLNSLALAGALPAQEGPGEFSLRDLVRASDGQLGVAARNMGSGLSESHDGGRSFLLGRGRSLVVAVAALDALRRRQEQVSRTLPYPREAYRGHGVLGRRHAERFSVADLVGHAIRAGDPSALDLLHGLVGSHGVAACMKKLGVSGLGRITSLAEERVFLLRQVDERLPRLPPEKLARWFDDGEATALAPVVSRDPRGEAGFGARLARARRKARAARLNTGTPAAVVELLGLIWSGRAGHAEDCALLREALRAAPRLTFADRLPIRWPASGLDTAEEEVFLSAGVVETGGAPVALALCANGYAWKEMVAGFFARMGRSLTLRLDPGAEPRGDGEIRFPRGVLSVALLPRRMADAIAAASRDHPREAAKRLAGASKELFTRGEDPTLVLVGGGESPLHMVVRWFLPGGRMVTGRATLPRGRLGLKSFSLARPKGPEAPGGARISGEFRVRVAVDGLLVFDAPFTISTRAP